MGSRFSKREVFLEIAFLLLFFFFFFKFDPDARRKMAHNRYPDTNEHYLKHLAKQHQSEEHKLSLFQEMVSFSESLISFPKPAINLDKSHPHRRGSAGIHSCLPT